MVVLDGELAVPCNPKSAYAGLNSLHEGCSTDRDGGQKGRLAPTQQTVANPVRSGRKQREAGPAVSWRLLILPPLVGLPACGGPEEGCTARLFSSA